jgi:HAD hydrolase, family IIB
MKVLASDFDNTLFVEEEISFEENIKSIREFMLMGNIFIIITGRSYTDLKQMLNKYKIPYNYLFCEDGARIYNNMDLCIDEVKINHEKVENILEILENYNCGYILDDGIEETTDTKNVVKVVIPYTDKKLASKILRDITKHVEIYGYISNNYINIISHKINKYLSLKKFIKIEEIKEKDLYVIGDNINDLEMLENFNGVIMKKHSKDLNKINKKEVDSLNVFIDDLLKNKFK